MFQKPQTYYYLVLRMRVFEGENMRETHLIDI